MWLFDTLGLNTLIITISYEFSIVKHNFYDLDWF